MKPVTRGRLATITRQFDVHGLEQQRGQNSLNGQPSSAFDITKRGETVDDQSSLDELDTVNIAGGGGE